MGKLENANKTIEDIKMKKWNYRKCSKCGGDTYIEQWEYGFQKVCLQCGKTVNIDLKERG